MAFRCAAFAKTWAFFVPANPVFTPQFQPSQNQAAVSGLVVSAAEFPQERRVNMDYLVVLATMMMIAGYACIVGRALRDVK